MRSQSSPAARGWLALGLAAALLPLLVLKYSGMLVPGLPGFV